MYKTQSHNYNLVPQVLTSSPGVDCYASENSPQMKCWLFLLSSMCQKLQYPDVLENDFKKSALPVVQKPIKTQTLTMRLHWVKPVAKNIH